MRIVSFGFAVAFTLAFEAASAQAEGSGAEQDSQLQRIYSFRTRLDQERRNRDNEARAFGNLSQGIASAAALASESPTVNAMRADMRQLLIEQGDSFKCNDIDVNNGAGQAIVICGSQTGRVDTERTEIDGDLINNVTNGGGRP